MTDIAVIGGGPAGAWAAYNLARCGARVRMLDASHPREKPCGGGVTGRALDLVSDALPRGALPAVSVATARFLDTRNRRAAVVPLRASCSSHEALVVASRADFDAALVAAAEDAGVEWIRARATDIVAKRGGGYRVATTGSRGVRGAIEARVIVGADGANSLVRRRVSRPFRRDQLSIATGYFAHGVTSDEIVVEIVDDPPGYIWSFPRPDHLAIGICAQADAGSTAGALRQRVARWIEASGVGRGATLEPYAWPIPSLGAGDLRDLAPAGADWFLIGDAAGLVDPLTREGIFFALQSAENVAAAIATGASYAGLLRRDVGAELARAARFKAGFFRPRFARLLIDGLSRSDAIRRVVADLVAGAQPYRGLQWRLVKTLEVRLALRALGAMR